MFSAFRKNIKYLEEVSLTKGVLFFAIVPLTIVMLNANFLKNSYFDSILCYFVMIAYALLVGRRELLLKPNGSFKKNIKIVFGIFAASAILGMIGVKIIGTDNPQGLDGVVYTGSQYLKLNSILPLIGFGEEFLCVLTFIGLFTLLPGELLRRFLFSLLGSSLIFGLLHAFHSPFTAVLAIGLGHIPFIFATLYYKSILPAIGAHIMWDGMNFFGHYNEELYFTFCSVLIIAYFVYIFIPKKKAVPS
ncbi:CPBP family intramembrane metalloprotease [Bacillus sp. BRMEA1]|uniref:CPBP family intramembrane glutamic endopeptidase n=1 Tax=Neobacillus endophyticus TaxID=2738405 RepID=UPI001564DEB9|nr:CPBP family intramembrane glutamic endopeptidase [Neobacillus endophyticus]NRD81170.1 CPBP family intramembrane metalloprotease [Neobacillus endophyticus]